jgi:hypothetical protein
MDPNSSFGSDGMTVKGRLDRITRDWNAQQEIMNQFETLHLKASSQDMISYLDRVRSFGEDNAMKWLVQKYGDR